MKSLADLIDRSLNVLLASLLVLISVLIFMNVGLRYLFNSGLVWAEELTRFLFVWLVFLGAISALKENNHLGFTAVVKAMSSGIKKAFFVTSNIMMFVVLLLLLTGAYNIMPIGMMNQGAATGIPMAVMYAVVMPMSVGMAIIIVLNLYKAIFVEGSIDDLIALKESEEEAEFEDKRSAP
jgi:TRAP-type C4-dicarboxylate transport system permease small subunit